MKEIVSGGVVIRVGRNAKENDIAVASAQPHHLWFHLSGLPSAHVILCCEPGDEIPKGLVHDCALLVCHFSKGSIKALKRVEVSYCSVSNLTKSGCRCTGEQRLMQSPISKGVKWGSKEAVVRISNLLE